MSKQVIDAVNSVKYNIDTATSIGHRNIMVHHNQILDKAIEAIEQALEGKAVVDVEPSDEVFYNMAKAMYQIPSQSDIAAVKRAHGVLTQTTGDEKL